MSFGTAFQPNAFQNNAFQIAAAQQPGGGYAAPGGYYRRPTIYLDRDGNRVDLATFGKVPEQAEEVVPLPELSPEILRALLFQAPPPPSPLFDSVAGLDARMGDILLRQEAERIDDDDAALLLLMSAL